jgi:hypothetical protein
VQSELLYVATAAAVLQLPSTPETAAMHTVLALLDVERSRLSRLQRYVKAPQELQQQQLEIVISEEAERETQRQVLKVRGLCWHGYGSFLQFGVTTANSKHWKRRDTALRQQQSLQRCREWVRTAVLGLLCCSSSKARSLCIAGRGDSSSSVPGNTAH